MEKERLLMKPCKDMHKAFCGLGMLLPLVFLIIGGIDLIFISRNIINFVMGVIIAAGSAALILLVYFLVRVLFYRVKIVVTEEQIIKYHRGKIVFQIQAKDIIELGHRKVGDWFVVLFRPFGVFFGDTMCDLLSIRFRNADVESERIIDSYFHPKSLTEDEKSQGMKEYLECLTKKEIARISALLKIDTKDIDLA